MQKELDMLRAELVRAEEELSAVHRHAKLQKRTLRAKDSDVDSLTEKLEVSHDPSEVSFHSVYKTNVNCSCNLRSLTSFWTSDPTI